MASRVTDAILGNKAWNTHSNIIQLDPSYGGVWGWSPNPQEWLSNQAYIPRHLIPIVLESPRFFALMPNPEKWVAAFKAFFEKHARTIEGLKAGLTVDVAEHQFGGGGEMFQEYTDVKRERSTLTVGGVDKYGNAFQTFWEQYILYGMMHPETKTPLTVTMNNGPTDNLADWYSGTIAFIEPDPTGKRVVRCWIVTNVWPHGTGPIEGKLDKTSALAIKEISLEFSALAFYNNGTHAFGQQLLNGLNLIGADPQNRAAFINEISADVDAVTTGYRETVSAVRDNQASVVSPV